MLLINCERKGGPFQTPKIPRKHIIKAAVVQPVPPVSLPRPGGGGKNSSCGPQVTVSQVGMSGGQALSECQLGDRSLRNMVGVWLLFLVGLGLRQTTGSFLKLACF